MSEPLRLSTECENIYLQQLTAEDAPVFFNAVVESRLTKSGHLGTFVLTDFFFPTVEAVEKEIGAWTAEANMDVMGIWDRNNFVGCIDATKDGSDFPDLGYWLDERYVGRGYATIAARAMARYAKLRYGFVTARCDLENQRSLAVLARVGFREINQVDGMAYFLF